MKTDTPKPVRLKDYRPPAYLIDTVELEVSLHPTATRVRSRLRLRANPKAGPAVAGPLRLDGEHLALEEVRLDAKKLGPRDYQITDTGLTIPRPPAKPFSLETTTIVDPESNTALQGLYRTRGVYCTQCEAEGFRRITYFIDRPDILSTYTVRIDADIEEAPALLSNGNLIERGWGEGGGRHYAVWRDPFPKPCYLFALVGANLSPVTSTFKTRSGRSVELAIWVGHGKDSRAHWAMDALKRAMRWDERRFGREYDLDVFNIVAVSDFNMGAMENKGLNIFNDRLILASAETATDATFESIESVVAHEYFHNWTGNRITCRDWFQLCLKEGLTVFRDQEFSADERDPTVQRIADVRQLKALQFPEDAGPMAHPVRPNSYIEINNFYTATVYEKGAELVRMIRVILGASAFRKGMDLYFERHDGEAATIEHFLTCFEDANGRDLSQFKLWYSQSGTPELVGSLAYDKAARTAELALEQVLRPTTAEPKKKPLHIPVRLALIDSAGRELPLELAGGGTVTDGVVHLTKRAHKFRFTDVPSRPVASLLRGFSAPVNLTFDVSDADLEFLMRCDGDLFNRWQAAQTFATRTILDIVTSLTAGRRSTRGATYVRALACSLHDAQLQPAYRAELIRLPSQSDIAREIGRDVDPGIVHKAHRQLMRLAGTTLGDDLEEIYEASTLEGPFSPDARSAGVRALRNAALTLLVARGRARDLERLARHYARATSMTDAAHALFLLAGQRTPERRQALDDFYRRWKDDNLVIDTWFTAQAQSPLPSALDEVEALVTHPLFSLTAPNKVRALVGTFAQSNPLQFNRPDGAGYAFLARQVLAVDKVNPQIAARLLGSFRSWRALESKRRARARQALQSVARSSGLSRDVFEVVSRMLET